MESDKKRSRSPRQARTRILVLIFVVLVFGFSAKLYRGPADRWINNWGPASVAYVVFFMLLVFLVTPTRRAILPITVGVLTMTCALEFLQQWHPWWLQAARSTLIGAGFLGTTFSWCDFPAYFVGAAVGVGILHQLVPQELQSNSASLRFSDRL